MRDAGVVVFNAALMSWNTRLDLHLDVNASYGRVLLTSAADSSLLNTPPDMVAGDLLTVRLYFWSRGETPGSLVAADPGTGAVLRFSARPAGVPEGSDLLFLADDFSEVSAGVWEAPLSLNTAEMAARLAEAPPGAKRILGEVEVTSAGRTRSLQFDLTARPQVYDNQDTPLALPTPEEWLVGTSVPVNGEAGGTKPNHTIRLQTTSNISVTGGTQTINADYIYIGGNEWRRNTNPSEHRIYFEAGFWYITHRNTLAYAFGTGGAPLVFRAAGTIASDPSSLTYSHAPVSDGWGGAWNVTAISGWFAGVPGTTAPPYLRVAGGFLHIQEAGVWKKTPLSAL